MSVDIREWLENLDLGKYIESFTKNDIDHRALPYLDQEDLKELGVSLGHRKIILAAISELNTVSEVEKQSATTISPVLKHEAERRQLTVMFCDLVGSTELSQRLDPEDMREALMRYQDAVTRVVSQHDGYVANYLGDGVLAYFGWPQAQEEQAAQAVRAGLAVIEAMSLIRTPEDEAVLARVGIASGQVVVGDLEGETARQADAVSGETPNLAARLQTMAEPGQVVIDASTRMLSNNAFNLLDLGPHELKGIDQKVQIWGVTGERVIESRFEALRTEHLSPLIGREHEVALILDRYRLACSGEGQVMLLSGEPGIGKSRIIIELREQIQSQTYTSIRYFCSPYLTNTAFHPLIAQLQSAARLERGDTTNKKLEKIQTLLSHAGSVEGEAVLWIADLLSLELQNIDLSKDYTPQQRKAKTFNALLHQAEGLAAQQPLFIVLENAHWLDPTSIEFFGMLIEHIQTLPVFLVITYRPHFLPPWLGYPHITSLTLNRLGLEQTSELVTHVTGGKALPDDVMNEITTKTDGVPLFIEELTKTVTESDILHDAGDHYELESPLTTLSIPTTLQDSLVARLDRLATAKEVAQIAACVGREVPYRLLRALVELDEPGLQNELEKLVDAELLLPRGLGEDTVYIFRHGLMQEAAHQTLLKSRRKELHERVAKFLVKQMPEVSETKPEVIARHYTEAGLSELAIDYWLKAAQLASRKPAFKEALAHLENGLNLIPEVKDENMRVNQEIELRLNSGIALHASRGPIDDVRKAYSRARTLCQQSGDDRRLYASLWGLWFSNHQRGKFEAARDLSTQLLELAEEQRDNEFLLQAHHAAWTTCLCRGELNDSVQHAEAGKNLYKVEYHHTNSSVYSGHDAGVCCRYTAGLIAWLIGQPDLALEQAMESIELAEQLEDPYSLALALTISCVIRQCRREVQETIEMSERLRAISDDHGFTVFFAGADIMHGWGLAASNSPELGTVEIRRGLDAMVETGARLRRSYFLYLLADAYKIQHQDAPAMDALEEAATFVRQTGERWWEAEILRSQGELLESNPVTVLKAPEELFQQAITLAERQGALSLSLRAATSYGQFCILNNKKAKAQELVEPIYKRMVGGSDTADLRNAKSLLESLSA